MARATDKKWFLEMLQTTVPMEGTKFGEAQAPKDPDRLKRLVNPHCIESRKIWASHGPTDSPVPPALVPINAMKH